MIAPTVGWIGNGLMLAGSIGVTAAAWTNIDWLGAIGLALWLPGSMLFARWDSAIRRANYHKPRLNPQAGCDAMQNVRVNA